MRDEQEAFLKNLDMRFSSVSREIWTLEAYLQSIERQIDALADIEYAMAQRYLVENNLLDDEYERDSAFEEANDKVEYVIPRLLRNSQVIFLWSVYESAVNDIASYITSKRYVKPKVTDIGGLGKLKEYFKLVLEFDLFTDEQTYIVFREFVMLRNIIAHQNGRIDNMKADNPRRKPILELVKLDKGVSLEPSTDSILLSSDYIKRITSEIIASLKDLMSRVKAEFPK